MRKLILYIYSFCIFLSFNIRVARVTVFSQVIKTSIKYSCYMSNILLHRFIIIFFTQTLLLKMFIVPNLY